MTKKGSQPLTEHYIVPARQLSGTRDEVLAQINELILGLTGLRHLVSRHGPTPAEAPRRKLHLVKGFLKMLFVTGIAMWASPAQGQTGASGSTPPAAQDDRVSLLYMLSNGIQQTEDFNDFKSNQVAAVLKPTGRLTWVVNYYVGQEQPDGGEPGPDGFFKVIDTNVGFAATSRSALVDLNHVTNEVSTVAESRSLQGLGAYARYQMTTSAAVGVRYERLDEEGLFGGIEQVLQETTLTAEYKLADGFLVRAEFRRDWSNERFFPGRLGDADLREVQNTALVGGVWWFGTKAGVW